MTQPELRDDTPAADCDRAPIHTMGAIQPHGCLIAFSWPDQRIQLTSDNTELFFDRPRTEILGSKIDHLFDKAFLTELSETIRAYPWASPGRNMDISAQYDGKLFDAFIYKSEGLFVLEFEPSTQDFRGVIHDESGHQEILRAFSLEARALTSIEALSELVCTTIRDITGLDRVMMYRFAPPEWHGEVIAEARIASAHAYMGHRFPATDIPLPARDLYRRNQVRLIANVNATTVPLFPQLNPTTSKPFDLSDSRLRASAPIHVEYLKNMRVGASFSVAVIEGTRLWGLITCHHMSELVISQSKRSLCEIIAQICSMQISLIERNQSMTDQIEFDFQLRKVVGNLMRSSDPIDQLFRQHRTVLETFAASGIALVSTKLKDFAGLTPLKSDVENLGIWLRDRMNQTKKEALEIDSLSGIDPRWESVKDYVSGVLAIRLPHLEDSVLMIFRPEIMREVSWGGDPRKQLEKRNFQGQIHSPAVV